jgi:hypothetical protein
MQKLLKWLMLACLVIALTHPAVGEIVKKTIKTDSSWKCLDVEQEDWNTLY